MGTELNWMARPTKWRKIEHVPTVPYFVPTDQETNEVAKNIILFEEIEALRLKDLEGLEQEECANRMQVSRPTFQRILLSAREKVADSLVNGKVMHITGGNFTRNICAVQCVHCGKEWVESYENLELLDNSDYACPNCGSSEVFCRESCNGKFCRKNCHRHGRTIL